MSSSLQAAAAVTCEAVSIYCAGLTPRRAYPVLALDGAKRQVPFRGEDGRSRGSVPALRPWQFDALNSPEGGGYVL